MQTRSETPSARLMVVDSWLTGQSHRADDAQLARLRGKIVDAHDGILGLIMMQRQPGTDDRPGFRYLCYPILPSVREGLPSDFLDRLLALPNVVRVDRP